MFRKKTMEELNRSQRGNDSEPPKFPILIILDDVRSMHNVGSAFRTADAFGAGGIWLCGYTPRPPHRDIHKTALGATDTVAWKYFEDPLAAALAARDAGYKLVAAEQTIGSTSLESIDWQGEPLAVIFGNEVTGVSDKLLEIADACVEIPQFGSKHSLNISVSVGVVLWELVRKINS
jgi:23S rRNA (guanosine2251-2'-O)-methyltransferase